MGINSDNTAGVDGVETEFLGLLNKFFVFGAGVDVEFGVFYLCYGGE